MRARPVHIAAIALLLSASSIAPGQTWHDSAMRAAQGPPASSFYAFAPAPGPQREQPREEAREEPRVAMAPRTSNGPYPFGGRRQAPQYQVQAQPVTVQQAPVPPNNAGGTQPPGPPRQTWADAGPMSFSPIPNIRLPSLTSLLPTFSFAAPSSTGYPAPTGRFASGNVPGYIDGVPVASGAMVTGPVAYGPAYPYALHQGYDGYAMSGPPMTYPAGQVATAPPATGPAASNQTINGNFGNPHAPGIPAQPVSTTPGMYPGSFPASFADGQGSGESASGQANSQAAPGQACPPGYQDPYCYPYCPPAQQVYTTIGVDVIGLRRSEGNSTPIILDAASCCIAAGDLEFEHELGFRVNMVRDNCCGWGWELAYTGLPSWNGAAEASGNLSLEGPGFQLQVLPAHFVVNYESTFHSAELNLRLTDYCRWSAFAGFRYMRFSDALFVWETNTPFWQALDIDAVNNLYGFHFGADVVLYDRCGPLRIELGGGVGIYGNDASQITQSTVISASPTVSELGCRDAIVAVSAQAELRLSYRITNCLEIQAGYQVLGIGNVAYAVDQLHASDYSTGFASVHYNHLLLDGGHLGIRYCW